TISEYNKSWKDYTELDKTIRSRSHKVFDAKFREERFVKLLSDTVANYSELAKITGIGKMYQLLSNRTAQWNNDFVEPFRDTLYRTPLQKVCEIEKYSLFRYDRPAISHGDTQKDGRQIVRAPPVLVIYAFINRHYILDLLPEVSVIRNLLKQGLDIFAADWGTPAVYDKTLTIDHFVNQYLDKSIDFIRKVTKVDKVTLFGYCWGGDLALMYAALHPEKVKNLVTIATPGDFDLDDSLLSVWTRAMKEQYILDAFGNMPGMLLNAAFNLRRPIEYSHKYFHFFEQPRDLESIAEFLATETWLYDSPPIIGEIYREFVEYCYKQNLLIKNKMRIEDTSDDNESSVNGKIVNLKNITMPFLNVIAQKDDLVAPSSSKALNDALTDSRDKSLIEFNSGHVGLMIGKSAHKELWPKAGEWIKNHS
ncbi:MAG TPA: alpha/beta fold hydrolase, partial [Nitrososphaeraceae archaeon]|nr:alpha/beta fold hydrolase [Nitrososphaeraceae archaeon]